MSSQTLSPASLSAVQRRRIAVQTPLAIPSALPGRAALPAAITRAASKQTYYTVRFLVDRGRRLNAYRAYAYFRWVDDRLDSRSLVELARVTFIERQQALVDACFRGRSPRDANEHERMLIDLLASEPSCDSGLRAYITNMMAVMKFDTYRRGKLVSQAELDEYTYHLAAAVTEALHYFIGHDSYAPLGGDRYLAATGAHIVHMLRDTHEDVEAGYYNVPRELLQQHGIAPSDTAAAPYRDWVSSRVRLARGCFDAGRRYLAQVESLRCRVAGYAYIARFTGVLDAIEREGCVLRESYPERKSLKAGLKLGLSVLAQSLAASPP